MYDGGNIEYIVRDTGLQWPNGLAVDSDGKAHVQTQLCLKMFN